MSTFRRRIMMAMLAAAGFVTAWFHGEGFFHGEGWFHTNSE